MFVRDFMVPAQQVVTCKSADPLQKALDLMVEKKVGCVVVLDSAKMNTSPDSAHAHPTGIVSKADFLKAYQNGFTLDASVCEIMSKNPEVVRDNISRDDASKFFEKKGLHHALVANEYGTFIGLISTWDIAVECARDDRAWPFIRSPDGRFHHPNGKDELSEGQASPRSPAEQQQQGRPRSNSHAFLDYIDSIRDLQYTIDST